MAAMETLCRACVSWFGISDIWDLFSLPWYFTMAMEEGPMKRVSKPFVPSDADKRTKVLHHWAHSGRLSCCRPRFASVTVAPSDHTRWEMLPTPRSIVICQK